MSFIAQLLPSPLEVVISILIILAGIAIIPILAWFKLLHPKGVIGRILWTIGAVSLGPYAIIQDESGSYRLTWVRRAGDDTLYTSIDGERLEIDEVPEHCSRLGKTPFMITYLKSERLFRDVLSDVGEAMPDGGLEGERGGYHSYVPEPDGDGYLVRIHRLLERLREAGGSRLADLAEEEGLREFGGNPDVPTWVLITYVIVMLLLGMVGGLWYVG